MDGEQYCGEGWARGAQPMRKPFDAAAAKRRGRAPPNKLDEPQDLGTSMLGHLLAIATTFCGHVMLAADAHRRQQQRFASTPPPAADTWLHSFLYGQQLKVKAVGGEQEADEV